MSKKEFQIFSRSILKFSILEHLSTIFSSPLSEPMQAASISIDTMSGRAISSTSAVRDPSSRTAGSTILGVLS